MSTRLRSARAKEQGAVDDLLQNLLQDGAANGVSEAIKTGPGTLADASLAHVDQLLDRVSSRRKQAQERKAASETNQGGRKRKQQALGHDSLFLQQGSGRALRRRTGKLDEPACGAFAQTAHSLEHGNSTAEALNGEDLAITDASENADGLREEAGLGNIEGMEVAWEVEARLESRSALVREEQLELKGDAVNNGEKAEKVVESTGVDRDGEALSKEHSDWEEGFGHASLPPAGPLGPSTWSGQVAFDTGEEGETEGLGKPRAKPALRRASAKDREFATLVHKAHLLCLVARGIRFDTACDDLLVQASLLSCAPEALGELSNRGDVIQASDLSPLMEWFQEKFRVVENVPSRNGAGVELRGYESDAGRLQAVLEKGVGTAEEIVALFVALCRALGLTTRYVCSLDVTSLKPDAASLEASLDWDPDEEFDDSAQVYLRGGAAVAQMLRQLAPPAQTINTSATPSFLETRRGRKAGVENGVNGKGGDENGILNDQSAKEEQENAKGRKGKQKGGWTGSAKVLDAKEDGQGKKARTKKGKQMKEEEGGHGMKMEELTEEEQLAQAIAASLGEGTAPSNGGKSSTIRKSKKETDAGREAAERRRKGDEEMEAQLQMAMAATAIEAALQPSSNPTASSAISRLARGEAVLKGSKASKTTGLDAGAVWSRRRGPALQWGEVYCGGGKEGGRWVHVDPAGGMIDAPGSVEAAAGGKQPLQYVLAFAGGGAKDITRRYVSRWSVVAPLRIDNDWWEETLRPLRRLEAAATSGRPNMQNEPSPAVKDSSQTPIEQGRQSAGPSRALDTAAAGSSGSGLCRTSSVKAPPTIAVHDQRLKGLLTPPIEDRAAKEDMDMETRTLTEPLPTNQQAYKSHHLYTLERWLTKYQVLHPKRPILGYCAGQPVYPRTSVQVLHTADRWLREGRKVKRGSLPAKVIQASKLASPSEAAEQVALGEEGEEGATSALFGRWQTDEWRPPPAREGRVPRNERGQVDVWDESFLPAGTVHLRYPRIVPVARRMKVDYAPAMVGFEVKGGRSVPKFDGIVICKEFERDVLDSYLEEEQRAYARELRKREYEAALRWRQLLKAVALRQRLRTTYEHAAPAHPAPQSEKTSIVGKPLDEASEHQRSSEGKKRKQPAVAEDHEHVFPEENQSYDMDTGVRTKRCPCGFSFDVEEM